MFKRIDHVEIVTGDLQRSIEFYTRVLGFGIKFRDRVPAGPGVHIDLVYLDLGGTVIELIAYAGRAVAAAPAEEHLGYRMMALEVEDMAAALAHLAAAGHPVKWGPIERATYARAEIEDPDGHRIELRQWKAAAAG